MGVELACSDEVEVEKVGRIGLLFFDERFVFLFDPTKVLLIAKGRPQGNLGSQQR